ncbi:MAG: adenylosuccinate lyase, partial [Anaerolineae bacterium]|nr:adenylosuccinate lyase [Anaerolineae bacterium]
AELEEPHTSGKVGSSTMPQKRNPMLCESILTLARLMRGQVAVAMDTLVFNEHERDWSAVQMEWAWVPQLCVMCQGALEITLRVLTGLQVNEARMRQNLDLTGGLLLAERVMFALAPQLGRQRAHDVVHACAMAAHEQGRPFSELLAADPRITRHLSREQISKLLDPAGYTGLATAFVDRVLADSGGDRSEPNR